MSSVEDEPDIGPDAAPGERSAGKRSSPVMDFVLAELRANPELKYQELKSKAELNKLEVFPILYGRAKALLGLVPTKPRTPKRAAVPQPAHDAGIGALQAGSQQAGSGQDPAEVSAVEAFLTESLRQDPYTTLREITHAAAERDLEVSPHLFFQAKARVGLARTHEQSDEHGQPSPANLEGPEAAEPDAQESVPRPRRSRLTLRGGRSTPTTSVELQSLVDAIRDLEEERNRLRHALERIVEIIEDVT